jgi:hypothetical protein
MEDTLHTKCLYGLPPVAGNAARHFVRRVVEAAGVEPVVARMNKGLTGYWHHIGTANKR